MNNEEMSIDERCAIMATVIASAGISTLQFLRNLRHDVIKTPDGEICNVKDAPAVEYADGRKVSRYGTYE